MEKVMKTNGFQELNEVEVMETEGGKKAITVMGGLVFVVLSDITIPDLIAHQSCEVGNCRVTSWEDCCPYNQ